MKLVDEKEDKEPHWVRNPDFCIGESEAYCSVCGQDVVYIVENNMYWFAPYCPRCGSPMNNGFREKK